MGIAALGDCGLDPPKDRRDSPIYENPNMQINVDNSRGQVMYLWVMSGILSSLAFWAMLPHPLLQESVFGIHTF